MNLRSAAMSAALVTIARKVGAFVVRFLRNQPATAHEDRVFAHLNGLVDALANQMLNRTFTPTQLKAVK